MPLIHTNSSVDMFGGEPAAIRLTWEELAHHQVPDWYRDAKLGIYMHWGVYSVPAFSTGRATSDKYSRAMYIPMPEDDRFAKDEQSRDSP